MDVFENYYFPSEFKTRYEVGAILIWNVVHPSFNSFQSFVYIEGLSLNLSVKGLGKLALANFQNFEPMKFRVGKLEKYTGNNGQKYTVVHVQTASYLWFALDISLH